MVCLHSGTMNVIDSTISDNQAEMNQDSILRFFDRAAGAGIYDQGTLSVTGSTIAGNTAQSSSNAAPASSTSSSGAGIETDSATISDSTIVDNSDVSNGATSGGGLAGSASVSATIVAQNAPNNCGANVVDEGYNLDDDGSCQFTAVTSLSDKPAGLDPTGLQNNGGPTETILPVLGSPAIGVIPSSPATTRTGCRSALGPISGEWRALATAQSVQLKGAS